MSETSLNYSSVHRPIVVHVQIFHYHRGIADCDPLWVLCRQLLLLIWFAFQMTPLPPHLPVYYCNSHWAEWHVSMIPMPARTPSYYNAAVFNEHSLHTAIKARVFNKIQWWQKNNMNDLIAFMFRTTRWERTDTRYCMWGCLQPARFLRTNLLLLFLRWNEACGEKKAIEEAEGDKFIIKQGLAWGRMNLKSIISRWRCWTHCPLLLKAFTGCKWSSALMVSYKEMKKTVCRMRDSWLKG